MKTVEEHTIPVMVFRKRSELYPLLEKLNGQTDRGILDFAELQRLHPMQLEDLLRPVLDKWMADALLEKRNGRYYITLEGSFWYRDIARILLYMTEIAAFGEMTEVEKAEQKQFMMRGMNSLK
jgi:coproporphyrinogen III oxidase-like Fe-S oxidoreductase